MLVAQAVFARPGEFTRADVAGATGMTRSTVSRLVDQLVAGGILAEDDPAQRGRGRPGVPLRPAPGTFVALGLEANVGHLASYVIDLAGRVLARRFVTDDLAGSDADATLARLADLGAETLADAPAGAHLLSAHVALPGIVDHDAGVLLRAPNLGWSQVAVLPHLARWASERTLTGLDNEADCAALTIAQPAPGYPGDLDSFVYVSGNVGIGSSTVLGGQVLAGRHGWAGELGHVCVDPDGPVCGCGARGCLEAVAGRRALLAASGRDDWDVLVADAAAPDPDPALAAALTRAGRALGIALSAALNLLDLSHVVLGGHLAELADALTPAVRAELDTRVLSGPFEPVQVSVRTAAEAPGALGAAYHGIATLLADPARVLADEASEPDAAAAQA
ncbi:ROK family transcriptional regulator [Propioniciclava soli]|uniref:ROK family transcriptional regulator n=1 Tax=Propioniciclava soli TaxID=2775081 RepID=A0ABZ3CCN3_9ACTN